MIRLVLTPKSLEEYSHKSIDRRLVKILLDIAPDKAEKVDSCRKNVRMGECEDHGHRFFKGSLCRLRTLCPIDAQGFSLDEAEDGYEILHIRAMRLDGKRDRVWIGVFTLPRLC